MKITREYKTLENCLETYGVGNFIALIRSYRTIPATYTTIFNEVCGRIELKFKQSGVYFMWKDSDVDEADFSAEMENRLEYIALKIFNLKDTYGPIIKFIEDERDNALNAIKSTQINRFNDTPQNSGTYEDDAYNTTVSKTEVEVAMSMADKIAVAEKSLADYYDRWASWTDEFIIRN